MRNRKGFTLAELMVVVAIIGVLVAVSIPVFTSQIHKAEVAADWANVRSYYSQLQYDFMESGTVKTEYLCEFDGYQKHGLKSFNLAGQNVKLKAGAIGVRLEQNGSAGYNIVYECNNFHKDCELILPKS